MLTPESEDIRLDGTAWRPIIIKTSDSSIYLKRGNVKQTAFEGVKEGLTEGVPVVGGGLELGVEGSLVQFQGIEGSNGGVDIGLGCSGGLQLADGVGLGLDGGQLVGQCLAEEGVVVVGHWES